LRPTYCNIPVCNRRNTDRAIDHLVEVLQEHHRGNVTAVSCPDCANFRPVYELESVSQVGKDCQLILHFNRPYPALDLAPHLDSLEARPSSVDLCSDVAPGARQVPGPGEFPLGRDCLRGRRSVPATASMTLCSDNCQNLHQEN
jgi:hypothetical protein